MSAGVTPTHAIAEAATAILTCIFRGDPLGPTTWTKSGVSGELVTGVDTYTVTTRNYDAVNYIRTDKLIVEKVKAEDDGEYTCKATYTQGSAEIALQQTLHVYSKFKINVIS